ncbi:hypothetical protein BFW01_g10569 [Lasiodiplodia theobromae]|uniref:Zn(2)-C6 fungal-type domain-containing protein n=2 Tax=Lasiodiplodia TaxID=66739 RepID=A0A8H7IPS3_9PEZI|nr:Zn 2cys6 transcription factor [Lasiodiplodia theobromae]KAF4543861.1 Zn 2cys6 transcription factor [Lasiodiplodia theobromae]KAF9629366.1 hypothetical protein BFW01_g10569 [Lasiodiplodia theobromae]KAK0664438.1 Adhesion and hyphal regulator 1 [Lasiodiplodia hormozganensis]
MLATPSSSGNPPSEPPQAPQQQPKRKPRKPRGRGLRTTTGCAVCRARHMKCDEVKPICGPCSKGNRPCVYHAPAKTAPSTQPPPGAASSRSAPSASQLSLDQQPALHLQHAQATQQPPQTAVQFRLPSLQQVSQQPGEMAQGGASLAPAAQVRWDPSVGVPVLRETAREDQAAGEGSAAAQQHISPPVTWTGPEDTMSPQSTLSSNAYSAEIAPLRWFGLLADDADNLHPVEFSGQPLGQRSHTADESSFNSLRAASFSTQGFHSPSVSVGTPVASFPPRISSTPGSQPDAPMNTAEQKCWQSTVILRDDEIPVFRHFVDNLSFWLDLYDPLKHFSSLVPQLAMRNEGLMKAILALSSRHLSIRPGINGETMDRTAAVQYYAETLQYLQGAMRYESFNRSVELLATALIVSKYEMIDGAGSGWERHLKGVFWIQRSQDINGQSGGLKQAVWWSWLRQDVWAAFRERRRCFSFYKPTRPYQLMDQYDMASRVVYLLAQAVNYASEEETKMGEVNLQLRIDRADMLFNMLEEWRMNLTVHFNPLPLHSAETENSGPFKPIWINPPGFAAAIQMHHFARILLLIHQPAAGGYREYLAREKELHNAIDMIVGLAMTIDYEPAEVVSTQCLYAAGLYANEVFKREKICELIEKHQRSTGWPVQSLADELRNEWARTRPP